MSALYVVTSVGIEDTDRAPVLLQLLEIRLDRRRNVLSHSLENLTLEQSECHVIEHGSGVGMAGSGETTDDAYPQRRASSLLVYLGAPTRVPSGAYLLRRRRVAATRRLPYTFEESPQLAWLCSRAPMDAASEAPRLTVKVKQYVS